MSKMFEMLHESLLDAIEYKKGKKSLRTKRIVIPEAPKNYKAINIKKIRSTLGITQTDFALWLNVSVNTVKAWEQNIRNPSHSALRLLEMFEKGFPLVQKMYNIPNKNTYKSNHTN